MSTDRDDVERLWNPAAGAFFDGKDDPNLAVLFFDVSEGQYWDSPNGRIGALIALVRAAIGGDDKAGDHGAGVELTPNPGFYAAVASTA